MTAAPRRYVRLTVGDRNGSGVVIENLHVRFDVEKTDAAQHIATIDVANLAPDTRRKLEEQFTTVILEYALSKREGAYPDYSTVFIGELYNVVTNRRESGDVVTTLFCGSGLEAYARATITETFDASAGVGDLVRALASELETYGVSIGVIDSDIDDVPSSSVRGQVLSGAVTRVLENVLEGTGFSFNIEGDELTVKRARIRDNAEIVITPATGLIGSVKRTHYGFDFDCVLNPALRPGITAGVISEYAEFNTPELHYMKVQSDTGGRVYVLSVKHSGSNIDGAAVSSVVGLTRV